MSRSIHTTRARFGNECRFDWTDKKLRREHLRALAQQIRKKRRIKRRARLDRTMPTWIDLPTVAPDAIPVRVIEQGPLIHYPASPEDLRAVMERLPAGVLNGLSDIRLCLGRQYQEEDLAADENDVDRDPWLGRAGKEMLPGVFSGRILGTCWRDPARIELYSYVYPEALPERTLWELYLRLQMLATFVHEVAHHDDHMRRVARGRWLSDDTQKAEIYAEEMEARWIRTCVVPYLEETYPDEVRELNAWIFRHGGTEIPLFSLTGDWRWVTEEKTVPVFLGSVEGAFQYLVAAVHKGGELTDTRLEFARDLHYGENYAEALRILDRVLEEQPRNLEALTLQADIFEHQGKYQLAESIARDVVKEDERQVDAWMVLCDVYQAQHNWGLLLTAAQRGLEVQDTSRWMWERLLEHHARAHLELRNFAELEAALEMMPPTRTGSLRAAVLRALLLLRTGRYEEAFKLAQSRLEQGCYKKLRMLFTAVRFEAAMKLGRAAESGTVTAEVLASLRRQHHFGWADRLVAEYGTPTD